MTELTKLRVAVARIAQVAGVETPQLQVLNKPYEDLCDLAETNERGWNYLAACICEAIKEREIV